MHFFIFIATLFYAFPAFAQEDALCASIHKSAAYIPNIDVYGNAVTPADLENETRSFIHDPIVIPVKLDLIARFGLTVPANIELEPVIAKIKIYENGQVVYGDEDITDQTQIFCTQMRKDEDKSLLQEDGHKAHHPIGSGGKTLE